MSSDHWVVSAGLVTTSALALVANALLLMVFFRRRGLRTVSNRFVINLLVTNLLSSVVLIPLLLIDQELEPPPAVDSSRLVLQDTNSSSRMEINNIDFQFKSGNEIEETSKEKIDVELPKIRHFEHLLRLANHTMEPSTTATVLCHLAGGSISLLCTASILSILLIAIDQYFAVTHPLRYHTFIDKFKSIMLLASTWLISLLFGLLGTFVKSESSVWNFCAQTSKETSDFQFGYNMFYAFTYLFVVILLPFAVICVLYGSIYCAAHRNSERMRKSNSGSSNTNLDVYIQIPMEENRLRAKVNSSDNVTTIVTKMKDSVRLPKVKSAPNFAQLEKGQRVCHAHSLRSNASFIASLKTKLSNASLFRYREETRAARVSVLVVVLVLGCYAPSGLAPVLRSVELAAAARASLAAAALLSPFLFAYRNRRVRRELRRAFGLLPRRPPPSASVYRARELRRLPQVIIDDTTSICLPSTTNSTGPPPPAAPGSILKRVCSKGRAWGGAKKCNFISVTECLSTECRCSFSSASTQMSSEEYGAGN